jgi:hypothetical protein
LEEGLDDILDSAEEDPAKFDPFKKKVNPKVVIKNELQVAVPARGKASANTDKNKKWLQPR